MIILVNLTLSWKALTANGNTTVHKSVVFYKGTQSALQKKKNGNTQGAKLNVFK